MIRKTGLLALSLVMALTGAVTGWTEEAVSLFEEDGISIEEEDLLLAEDVKNSAEEPGDEDFFSIEESDVVEDSLRRLAEEGTAREYLYEAGAGYTRLAVTVDAEDWVIKSYGFMLRRKSSAESFYGPEEDVSGNAAEEVVDEIDFNEEDLEEAESAIASEETDMPDDEPEEDLLSDGDVEAWDSIYEDGEPEMPAEGLLPSDIFYTAQDGIICVTTVNSETGRSHTGSYIFDENGKMLTGRRTVEPGTPGQAFDYTTVKLSLFTTTELAVRYEEFAGKADGDLTPVNSDIGQRKENYWFWNESTGKFQYFDNNGNRYPIGDLNIENAAAGYYQIRDGYYKLMGSGQPETGLCEINGALYYFQEDTEIPGQMLLGGWKRLHGKTGSRYLFFQPSSAGADRGKAVMHDGFHVAEVPENGRTVRYLLNKNGFIMADRTRVKAEDGNLYCSDDSGRIYQNSFVKERNRIYYAGEDGALFKDGVLEVDGESWIFFDYIGALM